MRYRRGTRNWLAARTGGGPVDRGRDGGWRWGGSCHRRGNRNRGFNRSRHGGLHGSGGWSSNRSSNRSNSTRSGGWSRNCFSHRSDTAHGNDGLSRRGVDDLGGRLTARRGISAGNNALLRVGRKLKTRHDTDKRQRRSNSRDGARALRGVNALSHRRHFRFRRRRRRNPRHDRRRRPRHRSTKLRRRIHRKRHPPERLLLGPERRGPQEPLTLSPSEALPHPEAQQWAAFLLRESRLQGQREWLKG